MDIQDFRSHPFTKFDKEWGLLTAGTAGDFNSMTISWGGMGTMWHKPVLFLVVKPTRHTFGFVSRHDELTVSFYEEKYRHALAFFGSRSGRDIDKPAAAGLTPKTIEGGMTYEEAKETIVCRKLFMQQLDKAKFPGFALQFYQGEKESPAHCLVIAEVTGIDD
ncbi:MAG: flavin reductase [Mailhella sp.]|nr:flavin reductase [Mailhella sp.]